MQLMSWNIQWGRGCDGRVDLNRIARVARATADFDVLCLQEVAINFPGLAGSSGEDQVALLSSAFQGFQAFYGIATDLPDSKGGRSHFGNLIFSRLPVLQVFRHLLPWPADPRVSSMQRICVEAVVQASWGPVRVMTTHLEYYSALQRLAQVEALHEIHRHASAHGRTPRSAKESDSTFAVLPRGTSAVLCGDFNFKPDAAEHARITAPCDGGTPSFVDAWLEAHGGAAHAHTVGLHECGWPEEAYCCDFIFVSADLVPRIEEVRVDQETDASDHQPIVLRLAD